MPVDEFPSNSKMRPAPQVPEKKIDPVVSGKVIKKKTPLHKKFSGTFFGGDARSALDYVVQNVLIPSAQKMLMDAITNGSSRLIWREPGPGAYGAKPQGSSWTPYGKFSTASSAPAAPTVSPSSRTSHDFGEVILEDRLSADRVLQGMYDLLNQYEVVTVADLYSLLGHTSMWTDQKFGWTDLRGSDIRIVPQGYMLILPKPISI